MQLFVALCNYKNNKKCAINVIFNNIIIVTELDRTVVEYAGYYWCDKQRGVLDMSYLVKDVAAFKE